MKIKLDENLPADLIDLFLAKKHDVHTVPGEKLTGQRDDVIFGAAFNENRLLVTQDLDFSDIRGLNLERIQELCSFDCAIPTDDHSLSG
jgi:predicted nuclease of predicted toxin-antitoxin system